MGESTIHFAAHDSRSQANAQCIGSHLETGKAFSDENQDSVGHCLPGEAGTGSAEGQVNAVLSGDRQHVQQVGLVFNDHYDARYQPVKTGIGAPGQPAQFVGNDPISGKMRVQVRN